MLNHLHFPIVLLRDLVIELILPALIVSCRKFLLLGFHTLRKEDRSLYFPFFHVALFLLLFDFILSILHLHLVVSHLINLSLHFFIILLLQGPNLFGTFLCFFNLFPRLHFFLF